VQLARELGVRTKTAWLNLMKLREALVVRRGNMRLEGHVGINDMYLTGFIRQENRNRDRVDRRTIDTMQQVVVLAAGERRRTGQTITHITPSRDADCAARLRKVPYEPRYKRLYCRVATS
jgi:hypothetical protein